MRYASLVFVLMAGCTAGQRQTGTSGPQGEQGSQGEVGSTGEQGPQGIRGERGREGVAGQAGPAGQQGVAGVQGVHGAAGANGAMGPAGRDGTPCYQEEVDEGVRIVCGADAQVVRHGEDGEQGPVGPEGPMGLVGLQGIAGVHGERGQDGAAGPMGLQGIQGPAGANGADGLDGTSCWDLDEDGVVDLNEDVNDDNVVSVLDCLGEQGPIGLAGPVGPAGPVGAQGVQGIPGLAGPQGLAGNDGLPGPQGPQGNPGVAGIQGNPGVDGLDGQNGIDGVAGEDGLPGEAGPKGDKGDPGDPGEDGQDLVAQCPEGSEGLSFNNNLMYCVQKLVFDDPQTWVQCLNECLKAGLFLAKEPDVAVICLGNPDFFIEDETVGEDADSTPGTCDDGVDNNPDVDELIDCLDPACALALNCDVNTRYHFESVDPSAGSFRLNPLARISWPVGLIDPINLCEEVTAFGVGDQLSVQEDESSNRLLLKWSEYEEQVALTNAELAANANPRRCLCGKRL